MGARGRGVRNMMIMVHIRKKMSCLSARLSGGCSLAGMQRGWEGAGIPPTWRAEYGCLHSTRPTGKDGRGRGQREGGREEGGLNAHAARSGEREGDGHGDLRNPRKGADSGSRGAGAIRSHNMCMEVLGSWREGEARYAVIALIRPDSVRVVIKWECAR